MLEGLNFHIGEFLQVQMSMDDFMQTNSISFQEVLVAEAIQHSCKNVSRKAKSISTQEIIKWLNKKDLEELVG